MRQKKSLEKCDTTPTFFHKYFWLLGFSETQNGSPTNILGLWDKNVQTEIPDTPFLLSIERFDTENFPKDRRVPDESVPYSEAKNFDAKSLIPALSSKIFDTRIFVKDRRAPTKFFGTVRQKLSKRKPWYPSFSRIFFDSRLFWSTKGSFTKCFGTVRKKLCDGRS